MKTFLKFFFIIFIVFILSIYIFFKKNNKEITYITKIIHTHCGHESLDGNYLAQILDLSIDKPIKTSDFDKSIYETKIKNSPIIKNAFIKLIKPDSIYIFYEIRQPIAMIYDYDNLAIDSEGYIFPIFPFLSPKYLPNIYLSMKDSELIWNKSIMNKNIEMAFQIINYFSKKNTSSNLTYIDVSNSFFESYGKRETIIFLQEQIVKNYNGKNVYFTFPIYLRLFYKNYQEQLDNYLILKNKILKDYEKQIANISTIETYVYFDAKTIDLRLDKLAFIK